MEYRYYASDGPPYFVTTTSAALVHTFRKAGPTVIGIRGTDEEDNAAFDSEITTVCYGSFGPSSSSRIKLVVQGLGLHSLCIISSTLAYRYISTSTSNGKKILFTA